MKRRWLFCASSILIGLLANTPRGAAARGKPTSLDQLVHSTVTATLDQLEKDGNFPAARQKLADTFDRVIALASPTALDSVHESALALRLVGQLQQAPPAQRLELLKYLRANRELAATLTFLMRSQNRAPAVYALLNRLREKHGKDLETYANLTAAICLVHDRPFVRLVSKNQLKSPDPVALFEYYVNNERRMVLGIRTMPAELLLYAVDTSATLEEMNWALGRYAGMRPVGQLFFAIRYDYDYLLAGGEKRANAVQYSLPSILAMGGVCEDQAYFAAAVGKAIGVPSTQVFGVASEAAHAWVGFFEAGNAAGRWNFDTGRYEAYQGLQGRIIDPQTRLAIPDSYLGLLAEEAGTTPRSRQTGRALTDAVRRLMELSKAGQSLKSDLPQEWAGLPAAKPRKADIASELELIELAVRQSPGDPTCWEPLRELADAGKLTLETKKHWTSVLNTVCGTKYPDFVLSILAPMARSEKDVKDQEGVWNWLFDLVRARADLAAQVRMEQAAMWEAKGDFERARACYVDVIQRYANAGPFVIDALKANEKLLRRSGQAQQVLALYDATWSGMKVPKPMAGIFTKQSNWFKVGELLAARLDEAGLKPKADMVRARLEAQTQDPKRGG
jgi:hypothetical protein